MDVLHSGLENFRYFSNKLSAILKFYLKGLGFRLLYTSFQSKCYATYKKSKSNDFHLSNLLCSKEFRNMLSVNKPTYFFLHKHLLWSTVFLNNYCEILYHLNIELYLQILLYILTERILNLLS